MMNAMIFGLATGVRGAAMREALHAIIATVLPHPVSSTPAKAFHLSERMINVTTTVAMRTTIVQI
jgi:hypothetical protein